LRRILPSTTHYRIDRRMAIHQIETRMFFCNILNPNQEGFD
jgi:hypothetical protein